MRTRISQLSNHFGSSLFKVAFGCAFLGLVSSLATFGAPSFPAAVLSFFYCICWIVWLMCALSSPFTNGVRLAAIWSVIDLAILAMFISISTANGDVTNAMGTEVVWLVSYLPVIIPTAIALPPLTHEAEAAAKLYTVWSGPTYSGALSSWLAISLIALLQSLALVLLARLFHCYRKCTFN